jgi:hypothetical protein
MQNINLSLKYLDKVIQDIYLDLNLLSTMPSNEHTKSVVNHTKDRVNLLENFLLLLNQFYENELKTANNKDEDNKLIMNDIEQCEL